MTFLEKHYHF